MTSMIEDGRRAWRLGVALVLAGALAGCGLFSDDDDRLSGEHIKIRTQQSAQALGTGGIGAPLPAPVTNADWTQTNARATHAAGHLAGPATLNRVWTADGGSGGSDAAVTSAPIVVGGRVFVLDAAAQVSAFDAGSGAVAWRTDLAPEGEDGENGFGGGLASNGQLVFATTGFGEVLALQPASGEIVWRTRGSAPFRAARAVDGETIVAVTRNNRAVALSVRTGDVIWRLDGIAAEAGLLGGASPAIGGGLAVIPFASGEVIGAQLSNGRRVWNAVLGGARRGLARSAIADVTGDPVIAGRAVIAANQSGRMVAIDGQTGQRGWTRSIGSTGPMWAAGRSLFLVADDSALMRLSLEDGATIWRTELPAFEDPEDREDPIAYSGPVLAGGKLLITSTTGELLSFDPGNGEPGEVVDISDGTTTGVAVAGGTLYVLGGDATLQAFR